MTTIGYYFIDDLWDIIKSYMIFNIHKDGKHLKNDIYIQNYNKSMQTSVLWGVTLTLFCLFIKFDTTTSVVIIALQIASFTYGSLIGLFLLSKLSNNFSTRFGSVS